MFVLTVIVACLEQDSNLGLSETFPNICCLILLGRNGQIIVEIDCKIKGTRLDFRLRDNKRAVSYSNAIKIQLKNIHQGRLRGKAEYTKTEYTPRPNYAPKLPV